MTTQPLILLAEDDDELRDLIQTWLEREGHKIVAMEDGFQLLDYLELTGEGKGVPRPDLILSDA
jgi:CheY-like chemotaxis protein